MIPYLHTIEILGLGANFDEMLQEHVINKILFKLSTQNLQNNMSAQSDLISINLPKPEANNFIKYNNLDETHFYNWIDANYDIPSIQLQNIQNIKNSGNI
jgi:hypothetical protein